jgi:hypothetical protein
MAKPDKWAEGEVLFVQRAEMSTVEDDFERGEVGDEALVWDEGLTGPYRGYAEVVDHFTRDTPGVPGEEGTWVVYASWIVNEENSPASASEITAWKAGRLRLWSARLSVYVLAARIYGPPASAHIAEATGFEVV